MVTFESFIFSAFPARYKADDTYKDINGRGVLERYTMALGKELDDELIPLIEAVLDVTNPELAPSSHLNHISDSIGNPPDIFFDDSKYRKLLAYAFTLYKIKGTLESYYLMLELLGFNVTITEHPQSIGYWDELVYDEGSYDSGCLSCTEYSLGLAYASDDCTVPTINPIPQTIIDIIEQIVVFLEPIHARLRALYQMGSICEYMNTCFTEVVAIEVISTILYDEVTWDEFSYDEAIATTSQTLSYNCSGQPIIGGIGYWIIGTDFEVQ